MIAVIYRGFVLPGKEVEYIQYWKEVAQYFVKERGALGSTLHQTEEGMWVAYSRWPNKEARDASWPASGEEINSAFPAHIHKAIQELKSCLDSEQTLPEITMSIVAEVST